MVQQLDVVHPCHQPEPLMGSTSEGGQASMCLLVSPLHRLRRGPVFSKDGGRIPFQRFATVLRPMVDIARRQSKERRELIPPVQTLPSREYRYYTVFSERILWRFYNPICRERGTQGRHYNRVSMTNATQIAALNPFPFSQYTNTRPPLSTSSFTLRYVR